MQREHLGHLIKIWLSFAACAFPTTPTAVTFVTAALSKSLPWRQAGHRTVFPWEYAFSNCSINNIGIPPSGSCCIFCNSSGCNHKIITISYLTHHARLPDYLDGIQPTDGVLPGSKEVLQATLTQAKLHFSFFYNVHQNSSRQ